MQSKHRKVEIRLMNEEKENIQSTRNTAGMSAEALHLQYGNRTTFCGGVDVQHLMTEGSPQMVKCEISRLREIFPTVLILSPSHEALMPDVPLANLAAMFDECNRIIS